MYHSCALYGVRACNEAYTALAINASIWQRSSNESAHLLQWVAYLSGIGSPRPQDEW